MDEGLSKFLMFENRLGKVFRHLRKQAARQGITCYRVYDHDLPEFPLMIELYEDKLYVAEYKRRHQMSDEEHEEWLKECKMIMTRVLEVEEDNIYIKLRQRKESRLGQYQKLDSRQTEFEVNEGGLKFIINLSDYLDTGLFLDHRITRGLIRELAKDRKVLNLFCYTGSFSVYAAAGAASEVHSVDLSKTYLQWAERNVNLNLPGYNNHTAVHADVMQYLKGLPSESFDLIIMDPPTFSNSKRMDDFLDIQRDHVGLINECLRLLGEKGILFFSTNFTKFVLDRERVNAKITDITRLTTPFDFAGKLQRQCFKIEKGA
ncbi:MAG TPA: class I SAM-dependent methyltransferase [Chitinophagaceae bacterium]|nr:class I SAM-dependent methyltransferase [Chitinophagaceae bacterium]